MTPLWVVMTAEDLRPCFVPLLLCGAPATFVRDGETWIVAFEAGDDVMDALERLGSTTFLSVRTKQDAAIVCGNVGPGARFAFFTVECVREARRAGV